MLTKIIAIDDDPTGSQTVHGCLLLTRWDTQTLLEGLRDDSPLFFVLIAVPMAIMPQRSSRAMGMGLALVTILVYYSMFIICQKAMIFEFKPLFASSKFQLLF